MSFLLYSTPLWHTFPAFSFFPYFPVTVTSLFVLPSCPHLFFFFFIYCSCHLSSFIPSLPFCHALLCSISSLLPCLSTIFFLLSYRHFASACSPPHFHIRCPAPSLPFCQSFLYPNLPLPAISIPFLTFLLPLRPSLLSSHVPVSLSCPLQRASLFPHVLSVMLLIFRFSLWVPSSRPFHTLSFLSSLQSFSLF